MATMFLDESSGKVLALAVLTVVSISLIVGSRHQPFPEISGKFGWTLASITGLLALGETAPRPMSLTMLLIVSLILGSYGVLVGVHHMVRTRRDVFIAPMSGFVFCTGAGGLMSDLLGFLLIFPLTRKFIFNGLFKKFNTVNTRKNNFIDGEYEDLDEKDDR